MANPPFNMDLVDAERIAKDPRLPFEQAITDIHDELAELNKEAAGFARRIQEDLEDLGI